MSAEIFFFCEHHFSKNRFFGLLTRFRAFFHQKASLRRKHLELIQQWAISVNNPRVLYYDGSTVSMYLQRRMRWNEVTTSCSIISVERCDRLHQSMHGLFVVWLCRVVPIVLADAIVHVFASVLGVDAESSALLAKWDNMLHYHVDGYCDRTPVASHFVEKSSPRCF